MKSRTVFLIVILFSISLWILAVYGTRVPDIKVDARFGLAQFMPVHFWIALLAMNIANAFFALKVEKSEMHWIHLVSVVVTALFFWATPSFVESAPRVHDPYAHIATSMSVTSNGYIDFSYDEYLEWPIAFILGSIVTNVTGLPPFMFIQYFSSFVSVVLPCSMYLFVFKLLQDSRRAFASTLLFVIGGFMVQTHFSPNTVATMLFPLTMLTILEESRRYNFLGILLFSVLVMTHSITSSIVVLTSGGMMLLRFLLLRESIKQRRHMTIILYVIYFSWLMYFATEGFRYILVSSEDLVKAFAGGLQIEVFSVAYAAYRYSEVAILRRIEVEAYVILGLLGMLWEFCSSRKIDFSLAVCGTLYGLSILFTFIVPYFGGIFIPGEFTFRALTYLMFAGSICVSLLMNHLGNGCYGPDLKKIGGEVKSAVRGRIALGVMLFTVVLSPFAFTAYYVDESEWMMRESVLSGVKWTANNVRLNETIYMDFARELRFYNGKLSMENLRGTRSRYVSPYDETMIKLAHVCVFREDARIRLFFAIDDVSYARGLEYVTRSPYLAKVYDSHYYHEFLELSLEA